MKRLLCALFGHKWGKWYRAKQTVSFSCWIRHIEGKFDGGNQVVASINPEEQYGEQRECTCCGKREFSGGCVGSEGV
jgi:hypothetical protein